MQFGKLIASNSALPQSILAIKQGRSTSKEAEIRFVVRLCRPTQTLNVDQMKVHVVEARRCPFCQHIVNTYLDPRDPENTPHDGDISICANCSGLSVFQGSELRLPTPKELARSMRDKNLLHSIKELRAEQLGFSVF
jgi:hypothetical protein